MRYEIWNQRFIPSTAVVSGPDLVNRAGSRHGHPLTNSAGPGGPFRANTNTWLESARDSAQIVKTEFALVPQGESSILARRSALEARDFVINANKTRVHAGPFGKQSRKV